MPKITDTQRGALFKGFEEFAKHCNDHGIDRKMFIEALDGWELPITKEFLHEVWNIKASNMGYTGSIKTIKPHHVDEVWDEFNRFTGQKFGLEYLEFPHQEKKSDMMESLKLREKINYPDEYKKPLL